MRPPLDRDRLDEAKRRVPLSVAASAIGLTLRPNGVQCSPLRPDRHPSFSVTGDTLWRDHATGEGGDVVSFIARATGCEDGEAIKRLLALAGLDVGPALPPPRLALPPPARVTSPKRDDLQGLDLRFPSVGDLVEIQHARRWPVFVGLEIAARRGLLRVADVPHRGNVFVSWILTDEARHSAQARRLDGQPWPGPEGRAFKSKSLRSDENHPPGLADVTQANRPAILLCEGEPDTLAALTLAWFAGIADRVGVVCLTGASRGLPAPVLAALQGRRVRILRQTDPAGHRAALAWAQSLDGEGIACDVQPLDGLRRADGQPANDVADLLTEADPEQLQPLSAALLRGL